MCVLITYLGAGIFTLALMLLDDWRSKRKRSELTALLPTQPRPKDLDYYLYQSVRLFIAPVSVIIGWPYALLYILLDWRRERRRARNKRLQDKLILVEHPERHTVGL